MAPTAQAPARPTAAKKAAAKKPAGPRPAAKAPSAPSAASAGAATATLFTFLPSLYDGIHTAGLSMGTLDGFMASLPLAGYGLGWVSFCIAGLIIGIIASRFAPTKAVQE